MDSKKDSIQTRSLEEKIELLVNHSIFLKKEIDSAKTQIKKKILSKKLAKNNNRISNYILFLDQQASKNED